MPSFYGILRNIKNYPQISETTALFQVKIVKYWTFKRNRAKNPESGTSTAITWAREHLQLQNKHHKQVHAILVFFARAIFNSSLVNRSRDSRARFQRCKNVKLLKLFNKSRVRFWDFQFFFPKYLRVYFKYSKKENCSEISKSYRNCLYNF